MIGYVKAIKQMGAVFAHNCSQTQPYDNFRRVLSVVQQQSGRFLRSFTTVAMLDLLTNTSHDDNLLGCKRHNSHRLPLNRNNNQWYINNLLDRFNDILMKNKRSVQKGSALPSKKIQGIYYVVAMA